MALNQRQKFQLGSSMIFGWFCGLLLPPDNWLVIVPFILVLAVFGVAAYRGEREAPFLFEIIVTPLSFAGVGIPTGLLLLRFEIQWLIPWIALVFGAVLFTSSYILRHFGHQPRKT